MDLSVVVLSWNTARLTVRALHAARVGAGDLAVELICVDNASADDTLTLVRREVPQALVVENETNLGFARGNNRALGSLQGRYTCFLNSDCAPDAGSLEHVVRWLDAHPEAGIAAPRMVDPRGRGQKVARPEPTSWGLLHRYTAFGYTPLGRGGAKAWTRRELRTSPYEVASVTGACLIVRTDLLRELGGFDEGYPFYWEDVDLCRRARDKGLAVAFVTDGPAVLHEGGAATRVRGGPPRREFVEGLLRYERKRMGEHAGQAFAGLFVTAVALRALVEAPRLTIQGLRRRLMGRRLDARGSFASAATWLRLLERDGPVLLRLLRAPR